MLIDYAAITHPGKVRKNNEDAYLLSALDGDEPIINRPARSLKVGESGLLVAVADGMGGAAAGEVASREGLAAVSLFLFGHWGRLAAAKDRESELLGALETAVEEASDAVLRYSDDDRTARGMGSTLTAAVIWNGCAYVAQIGDSRAYLLRQGLLHQITEDQTLVNDLVAQGSLTREQARTHPQRNMITQALGSPQPLRVVLSRLALRRGDRLLCCSDGLHGEVPDAQIQEVLNQGLSPRRSLELLVDEALAHGGRDNITGVILTLNDPGLPLPKPGEAIDLVHPGLNHRGRGLWDRFRRFFGGGAP
ncbi:MAG: serine/threonine-protein phosphatase [Geothrix sp.]|uniref:PP2C family protein-serine/threonine phosphatase n=1 Tax=Geothrix sp. TaxID=1962974 RepID=UPI0018241043|nr:protein phosphatase 2C domain-containing protein [Geothrix sp.]NWJ39881.1 serine/threonine-protein phosphatase [Geothrix sp.]WIL22106.1 MAG: protein phosphatase 2C domain-containing protein [Geothrix sp.]